MSGCLGGAAASDLTTCAACTDSLTNYPGYFKSTNLCYLRSQVVGGSTVIG